MRPREPKKSEVLEVRLPHALKTAFMAQCRKRGVTASARIRRHIEADIEARRGPGFRLAAALAAGAALGAAAGPTLADTIHPSRDSRAAFQHLDANGDGVLSAREFGRQRMR